MEIKDEENVVEPTTNENVDTQTTEQKEVVNEEKKSFTEEQKAQMSKIIQDRVGRAKRAEERKYSKIIDTLSAGLGTSDLEEINNKLTSFYSEQGVNIPKNTYNEDEERILANHEAEEIINLGYDEIVNETDEMLSRGITDLSPREKLVYKALAEKRQEIENENSLKSIGVEKETIDSKEFKDFAKKFNKETSLTDIYEMYSKLQPKEEVKPMGSMKSSSQDDGIKEFYSSEDFDKLTPEQLDNPKIWQAVMKSRLKW